MAVSDMFLDLFLLLKHSGIPVSLREYLTLLQGLDERVIEESPDDFYYLCRTVLIKHESHLDRFDRIFGEYYKGIEQIDTEEFLKIPEEWLQRGAERILSEEDKEMFKSLGGVDRLMERMKELLQEQEERHEGGDKWIGTGGTSPFGAYGYNPEGIRIGQHESRNRRAVKVWDERSFRDLDDSVELDTRNMKMALKRLRVLTREGQPEELDLDRTIEKTSKNAGLLEMEMVPAKRNNVKVLLFFDVGGSMDDHIEQCEKLFSAARYEFKHLEYFYFHNCIYEGVWKDNARRHRERIPTMELLHRFNPEYKVMIVGDASMSPYELVFQGGSVEHFNPEAGMTWLERIKAHFPNLVWLNPVPPEEWTYTRSIQMIREFSDDRMFPLTLGGITEAVESLKVAD